MRPRHSTPLSLLALAACGAALFALRAAAEPRSAAEPRVEDTLPSSDIDLGDDPIGITGEERALDRLASERQAADSAAAERDRAAHGPRPPGTPPRVGEVLTALPGTREVAQRVQLGVAHGLLHVAVELQFATSQPGPTELAYRLAVPVDASLASLQVCNAGGCREGVADHSAGPFSAYDDAVQARAAMPGKTAPLPVAHARERDDARGHALWLRAAPIDKQHPLTLRVSYLAPLRSFGGHARISLPARGMDPQVAPAELTLSDSDLLDTRLNGLAPGTAPLLVDPWSSVEVSARLASGAAPRVELWRAGSGPDSHARLRVSAGPRPAQAVDLVLAIDVSPSTEGPTHGRLPVALVALLGALPDGSRVRAVSFAGQARVLLAEPSDGAELPLQRFDGLFDKPELGSATRFEAAWESIATLWKQRRGSRLGRQVLIVGDGGLTRGPARPFTLARRAGVVVNALNLDGRPARPALREGVASTGGQVLELGDALAAEQSGLEPAHLEERLAVLFAPRLGAQVRLKVDGRSLELGPLHAGEERIWEGPALRSLRLVSPGGASAKAAPAALREAMALRAPRIRAAGLAAVDPRDFAAGSAGRPAPGRADPRGPAQRHSGVSSDLAPVALAEPRSWPAASAKSAGAAAAGTADLTGKGMPQSPLLTMLRRRIVPVARGCFRRDRAGRLDYALRAVFEFELAEQEVVAAQITGTLPERLRACLLAAVDRLEVPRFSGTVIVRYPLHTQAETLPEQIQLSPGAAQDVDRLLVPADGS